jgi:osmotically-inducible protein OsmY
MQAAKKSATEWPPRLSHIDAVPRQTEETIMNSDASIRTNIEAELEFEPSVDSSGIGVAVTAGVVTLTGHVDSYASKMAAERAVARVRGVRALAEEIEVRLAVNAQHDDDEIARRAANVISWSTRIAPDSVHVKVEKGWVTLTGELDWQYQKNAVAELIRNLSGVVGESNHIRIRPHLESQDVVQSLAKAFHRHAKLESAAINVMVDGGKVTLSGNVSAWNDRRLAEDAAWAMQNVTEVVDHLVVI